MATDEYRRKDHVAVSATFVVATASLVFLSVAVVYYFYIRNKLSDRLKQKPSIPSSKIFFHSRSLHAKEKASSSDLDVSIDSSLPAFTFKQLFSASGGFAKSNEIGRGAFWSVYKGILQDGTRVAIKFMDGNEAESEFKMEVNLLGRLRCPYLLLLHGYCSEKSHRLLVFELMENGGLQEHLYPSSVRSSKLDWRARVRIAMEAAKGLEFLHEGIRPPVIHRDFKSSNVLLDSGFHVRICDFGLSKIGSERVDGHVSTRVLGTQGYIAPEYAMTGCLTVKSDVYSYGVVLLELMTGRVPVNMQRPPGEEFLVSWALPWLMDRDNVGRIMDPALEGEHPMKEVVQVAAIAAMCVQSEPDYRPIMTDVVQSLLPLAGRAHHGNAPSTLR